MKRASARVSVTELKSCKLVRIEGDIDETFDGTSMSGCQGVVVIDLEGVRRVTSHGVLHWITSLRSLDAAYYGFINCHPSTMDQFNLVDAFPQRGELLTFYAPYTCTQCQRETEALINRCVGFRYDEYSQLPSIACPKCGEPAEFDEVPELYFKYAMSSAPPRPPAAASALVGAEPRQPGNDRRFEMKKIVTDAVTAFALSGHLDRSAHFKRAADGVDGFPVIDFANLESMEGDGAKGLSRFIEKLGSKTVLARVPAAMVDPLVALFAEHRRLKTSVVSFLVPVRCTGCHAVLAADVAADRIADLVSPDRRLEQCPRCTHPLEPQWPQDLAERAATLPAGHTDAAVNEYLRAHRPSATGLRDDLFAVTDDPRQLLLGKYKILTPLGRGGMGEVFLARQIGPANFGKLVVLKRIRRDRIGDPHTREMFLKEARLAARLSHPNVVQIYDLERLDDNELFISMEYVNGIDLGTALQLSRGARLAWPIEICCRVLVDLCEALHAAHSYHDEEGRPAPIVHRDVSPSNILLSTDGEVKLADFGIAGGPDELADASVPVLGKYGYAAPEQSAGSTAVPDERTDIYAAGVVLYECVTLRPISRAATPTPTAPQLKWRPNSPPQICVARSAAPPLLQDVFERCIQPEPAQRYRSARDLGHDLDRIGRLVGEVTRDDLSLWIRRLVSMRKDAQGEVDSPIITMETGSSASRTGLSAFELGRGH